MIDVHDVHTVKHSPNNTLFLITRLGHILTRTLNGRKLGKQVLRLPVTKIAQQHNKKIKC